MFIGAIIIFAGTNESKRIDRSRGTDEKDDGNHDSRGDRSYGTGARSADGLRREEKAGEK